MQISTIGYEALSIGLTWIWKEQAIGEATLWHRAP